MLSVMKKPLRRMRLVRQRLAGAKGLFLIAALGAACMRSALADPLETSISERFYTRAGVFADPDFFEKALLVDTSALLELRAASGSWMLRFKGGVASSSSSGNLEDVVASYWAPGGPAFEASVDGPGLELESLEIGYTGDRLQLSVGRLGISSAGLQILSCAEFLSGVRPEELFRGNIANARSPVDAVLGRWLFGDAFFRMVFLPLKPQSHPLLPSSVWFPRRMLLVPELDLSFLTVEFRGDKAGRWNDEPSYFAEFGYAKGSFEGSFLFFSGLEPAPLLLPELRMFSSGTIDLQEAFPPLKAVGAKLAITGQNSRLLMESAYRFRKTHIYNPDGLGLQWILTEAPVMDFGIGLEHSLPIASLHFIGEYRDRYVFSPSDLGAELFSSMACLGIGAAFLDTRLRADVLTLVAPISRNLDFDAKRGYACVARLTFTPFLETEFAVSMPVFGGSAESLFGSYAAYRHVSLTMEYRN